MKSACLILLLIIVSASSRGIEDKKVINSAIETDPYNLDLTSAPECFSDINRICGAGIAKTNFQVISCLQDGHKDYDISESCQHLVWVYKRNLTIDPKYEGAVKQVCSFMIQKVPECQQLPNSHGHLIPCLIEYLDNISFASNDHCHSFLTRLKPVVFSDYRIIYKFSEACQIDIETLKCGRMDKEEQNSKGLVPLHQQGKVLTCLANEVLSLSKGCKRELLRVAELQADDYHNDRQLFLACRNDREKFCAQVESGEGRVYSCLFKHKVDPEMSKQCHDMLALRQKLQQEDYRVNLGLTKACHTDIFENHCFRHIERIAGFSDARLSAVLLCLEAAMRDGKDIKPECKIELKEIRRSLMEDYAISPSLVVDCSKEIQLHCGGNLAKNGRTIHCLMDLARPRIQSEKKEFAVEISVVCARSLENLLIQADVGENYAVDPILKEACEPVVRVYCDHLQAGEGRVMKCLLDSLEKPKMTDECKESLMEIQYFMIRDFRLDTQLYKACKADAVELCHAPKKWYLPEDEKDLSMEQGYLVFACLYSHLDKTSDERNYKPVSKHCGTEIKRVMRERARSVNLDPDVESECLNDLSKYCLNKYEKDEEMLCLEENFDKLTPGCMEVISEFVENADKDPSLNSIFLRACEPFWQQFCEGGDKRLTMDIIDESFEKELMDCLILNKNHPAMNQKCKIGVEYHQIVTLENYHLSHNFKEACISEVRKYCSKTKEKYKVVSCLIEMVLNDTMLDQKHRVSTGCQKQLDFELLQRSENIVLDPELNEACSSDVKAYCSGITQGKAAIIQCLTDNLKKLSKKCHKKIFKRLEVEALNPKTDYFLYTKCKSMIKKYCIDDLASPDRLFECLQRHMRDEEKFDQSCKEAVLSRAHIFARDIRLNRELSKACYSDVMEFCKKEISQQGDVEDDGRVVECLKKVFMGRNKQKRLTETCENHVRTLIRMSAQDFKLDASLIDACVHEIASFCHNAAEMNHGSETDRGEVEMCLKDAFGKELITRQSNTACFEHVERLIEESIIDVQADPKLFRICIEDLRKHCSDVPKGEGRKLDCLLSTMLMHPDMISEECKKILDSRAQLWRVVRPDLPSNLQEIAHIVSMSPSVNYFLIVFFAFVTFIFVGGLCFGRITKRVRREIKNR